MRTAESVVLVMVAALALAACAGAGTPAPEDALPDTTRGPVGELVMQTDGVYGYQMLRPAGWDAVAEPNRRLYTRGEVGADDQLTVAVVNLQLVAEQTDGMIAQYVLFEQDSSLEGWAAGIEQMWTNDGFEITRLETLPNAAIYEIPQPGTDDVWIVAHAIADGVPYTIGLTAEGEYADLDTLREDGVLDDFYTMVGSLEAIPVDPANTNPPLN